MPRYFLTPEAAEDLRGILAYIAEDNPESADKVLGRFLDVFGLLADYPDLGHFRADLTTHPIRFFPVYSYLVISMAGSRPVEIVRVLDGAQDLAEILNR